MDSPGWLKTCYADSVTLLPPSLECRKHSHVTTPSLKHDDHSNSPTVVLGRNALINTLRNPKLSECPTTLDEDNDFRVLTISPSVLTWFRCHCRRLGPWPPAQAGCWRTDPGSPSWGTAQLPPPYLLPPILANQKRRTNLSLVVDHHF